MVTNSMSIASKCQDKIDTIQQCLMHLESEKVELKKEYLELERQLSNALAAKELYKSKLRQLTELKLSNVVAPNWNAILSETVITVKRKIDTNQDRLRDINLTIDGLKLLDIQHRYLKN
jgi:hypothetical protein